MTAIRLTVGVIVAAGCGPAPLPQALPNEQLATAGTAAATRLTIQLEARLALWRPAAADGPALEVAAFGVVGQPPSVPGPLIRAPVGTEVTVTLANRLADTLLVTGLIDPRSTDTMVIAPGQTGASTFRADRAGLYGYAGHARRGASVDELPRGGQLVGVVAIDSAATGRDRIFAITAWNGPVLPATGDSTFLLAVNGKIWPHTPRIRLGVGDSAHWRVINFARSTHPMHLHGAYFRVDARGDWTGDTAYSLSRRRLAVTEVLRLRETMSISWSPHQPGNWLFHCHDAFHIIHNQLSELPAAAALWSSHLRGDTVHAQALPPVHSEEGHGMAGLVLGIEVSGPTPTRSSLTERRIDLTIQQRARVFGESEGIGAVLARPGQLPADSIQIPSAPLIAWRGQPTAVMVHNRLPAATSIHWHGLELESYFDGVAGFSGQRGRLAPEIAPAIRSWPDSPRREPGPSSTTRISARSVNCRSGCSARCWFSNPAPGGTPTMTGW